MTRQPTHRMSEQRLKRSDHTSLKADKTDNLIDKNNVVSRQAHFIKLHLRPGIDHVR